MFESSKKVQKTVKTKFRKQRDFETTDEKKKAKHHDKSFYRLVRQEKDEYGL